MASGRSAGDDRNRLHKEGEEALRQFVHASMELYLIGPKAVEGAVFDQASLLLKISDEVGHGRRLTDELTHELAVGRTKMADEMRRALGT